MNFLFRNRFNRVDLYGMVICIILLGKGHILAGAITALATIAIASVGAAILDQREGV